MAGEATFIGFGEAARAFADGPADACAYDRKMDGHETRSGKMAECAASGVRPCGSNREAVTGSRVILSLVTAGQALAAAAESAQAIAPGALFLDMNSVAPSTKRAAAAEIERAGARYVDVAVMSPVHPLRLGVPLLVAGPHAAAGADALGRLGFGDVRQVGGEVGRASAIKMVRSVLVKGLEALTAECLLAAEAAGVRGEVLSSLEASWPGADWEGRIDYNLDRMMVHGLRRAEEMDEVVGTLEDLGTGSVMSRATAERQRQLGLLRAPAPAGLRGKLAAILSRLANRPIGRAA